MRVIPNGVDYHAFAPDDDARCSVRAELGLTPHATLVGVLARNHPQKDYPNLLRAMEQVWSARPDVHLVAAGEGVTPAAVEFREIMRRPDLAARVHLLSRRDDTARLQAALDVFVLASASGEAFPLAVGEAMASGAIPVVTDVGDAKHLVGDAGHVVPPGDPMALSGAILECLNADLSRRDTLRARARQRVVDHFSLPATMASYMDVWREATGQS